MEGRMPYRNIDHTLKMLLVQVRDSMEYACEVCPRTKSPEQIFYWLKNRTVYRNDPPATELLQTFPTMMENNKHGITGAGDCDCFTIALISCLKANGIDDIAIILRGRDPDTAVHIYPAVWNGKKYVALDLTNEYYGDERKYPYRQTLPI